MNETIAGLFKFIYPPPPFWKHNSASQPETEQYRTWTVIMALHPMKFTAQLLDQPVQNVVQLFCLAAVHLCWHQVNAAVSWRDTSAMQGLLTCQSSQPECQTGQRECEAAGGTKSVIQHAPAPGFLMWTESRQYRALFNSRCFTLRPLPSFPGRRALSSIRRVTGTRKKEE